MESHYQETNAIDELYGDDPAAHCKMCGDELFTGDTAYTLESGEIVCSRTCALNSTLENDSPMCPVCEGTGGLMGILGNLAHFRCIDCGMEFSYNLDRIYIYAPIRDNYASSKLYNRIMGYTFREYINGTLETPYNDDGTITSGIRNIVEIISYINTH